MGDGEASLRPTLVDKAVRVDTSEIENIVDSSAFPHQERDRIGAKVRVLCVGS